ncbi:protein SMG9-like [Xiphophorus hellerii]|uniref:protein SMG9-like n=1 Tax=Xiphophorus hellerii TaxID=8084 RepID=UPI0013B408F8|nr:protein SMG9-like [Xiphophorus hellerii]
MSESGHSQPGMYGQGRRRRRRRGERDGPPGQNLSGPSRDREYQPRERRDGSEDPPGPLIQKTPIILAKPPSERAKPSQNAPVSGAPLLEKPIMLMKARDDGGKPGTPPEAAAQSSGPGPSKVEREKGNFNFTTQHVSGTVLKSHRPSLSTADSSAKSLIFRVIL